MKRHCLIFVWAAAALLCTDVLNPVAAQRPKSRALAETLRESRWKNRLLLIIAPTAQNADFTNQKVLLAAEKTNLTERNFLVLELPYDHLSTADRRVLLQKTGTPPARFAAVLIGKDGGVKLNSPRPITPNELFGTVDKMPMRRQEMRKMASSRR